MAACASAGCTSTATAGDGLCDSHRNICKEPAGDGGIHGVSYAHDREPIFMRRCNDHRDRS